MELRYYDTMFRFKIWWLIFILYVSIVSANYQTNYYYTGNGNTYITNNYHISYGTNQVMIGNNSDILFEGIYYIEQTPIIITISPSPTIPGGYQQLCYEEHAWCTYNSECCDDLKCIRHTCTQSVLQKQRFTIKHLIIISSIIFIIIFLVVLFTFILSFQIMKRRNK